MKALAILATITLALGATVGPWSAPPPPAPKPVQTEGVRQIPLDLRSFAVRWDPVRDRVVKGSTVTSSVYPKANFDADAGPAPQSGPFEQRSPQSDPLPEKRVKTIRITYAPQEPPQVVAEAGAIPLPRERPETGETPRPREGVRAARLTLGNIRAGVAVSQVKRDAERGNGQSLAQMLAPIAQTFSGLAPRLAAAPSRPLASLAAGAAALKH